MPIKVAAVIPARFASTRFPGKLLKKLGGVSVLERTFRQTKKTASISSIVVATDSEEIFEHVKSFGGNAVMTSSRHPSGTDRAAEAAQKTDADVIALVQGDEPMIPPEMIDLVVSPFEAEPGLVAATVCTKILSSHEVTDPNAVKVVFDKNGYALYFSRHSIPFDRDSDSPPAYYKHVGLYAYRREFLMTLSGLKPTPLESSEKLEQLRILENGYRIKVLISPSGSIGIDTPEDLARAESLLSSR